MTKLIFAILAFALAIGIFVFYTRPTYASIATYQAQVQQYQTALDKATQFRQLEQNLLNKYNSFDPNKIAALQTMVPDHVDNIGLVLELDSIASRYGLALGNIDLGSSDASQNSSSNAASIGSGPKYDSLTMQFDTYGTYDNFLSFLNDLQSSLRIIDIKSINLQPSNSGTPSNPTYHFSLTIQTYWLK